MASSRGFRQLSVVLGFGVMSGWHQRRGGEVVDTAVAVAGRAVGHRDPGETVARKIRDRNGLLSVAFPMVDRKSVV